MNSGSDNLVSTCGVKKCGIQLLTTASQTSVNSSAMNRDIIRKCGVGYIQKVHTSGLREIRK